MKFLKFLVGILTIFTIFVLGYGYLNENGVIEILVDYYDKTPSELVNNEYTKNVDVGFVELTNNFTAKNKQDLLNIYYTIISSGMNEFTFYCSSSYKDCEEDITIINYNEISQINNFVNVYNSFKSLKADYTNLGKVTVHITRVYSNEDIEYIKTAVDNIYNKVVKNTSTEDNIKNLHDYIINNTKYDSDSGNALILLKTHKANCNGYADIMSLLLDKLEVPNVRISSDSHIWNLVYVNNKWLHIDATWDDPVNDLDLDLLYYTYFLKTSTEIENDTNDNAIKEHSYNKDIYSFAN